MATGPLLFGFGLASAARTCDILSGFTPATTRLGEGWLSLPGQALQRLARFPFGLPRTSGIM
jgi:hypothetical protein